MDFSDFTTEYQAMLREAVLHDGMPSDLLARYAFDACLHADPTGRKAVYRLTRKADSLPALLRVTHDNPLEDALDEAALLQTLSHPAIPPVLEAFAHEGRHYVLRPYIPGRSLHEAIRQSGPLSPRDTARLALHLCDALHYLHTRTPPVVHRDIKPQNIIVDPEGSLHLIDFGIARRFKPGQQKDTAVILTEQYASPEAFGFAQTSPLADVYSLGLVLLFVSTGSENKAGLPAIRDRALRRFIARCTAFDPAERMPSVQAAARFLRRHTGWVRVRRRAIAALAAAALLAATAFLSYYIGQRGAMARDGEARYQAGWDAGYAAAPDWRVPALPLDPTGLQQAGNMKNGGFVTRSETEIFYLNNDSLYRMDLDGTYPRVMAQQTRARAIACHGDHLYYATTTGIHRIDITQEGAQPERFVGVSAERLHFAGDALYYQNASDNLRLYAVDLDGQNPRKMNDYETTSYVTVHDGRMYFSQWADGNRLYSCNLDGTDLTLLYDGSGHWPCVWDGRLYFNRSGNDAALVRMNLDGTDPQVLLPDSNNYVLATETGLFYVRIDEDLRVLEWMSPDGTLRKQFALAESGAFNLAGDWIFYLNRDDGGALWRVRMDGSENQRVP